MARALPIGPSPDTSHPTSTAPSKPATTTTPCATASAPVRVARATPRDRHTAISGLRRRTHRAAWSTASTAVDTAAPHPKMRNAATAGDSAWSIRSRSSAAKVGITR